jgi:hypothetical protein
VEAALRFDRPLVVRIDVEAHARIGPAQLLGNIVGVIVMAVDARLVVGQFVEFEPLVAHLGLVYRLSEAGEDRAPVAAFVIDRHMPLRDRHLAAQRDRKRLRERSPRRCRPQIRANLPTFCATHKVGSLA